MVDNYEINIFYKFLLFILTKFKKKKHIFSSATEDGNVFANKIWWSYFHPVSDLPIIPYVGGMLWAISNGNLLYLNCIWLAELNHHVFHWKNYEKCVLLVNMLLYLKYCTYSGFKSCIQRYKLPIMTNHEWLYD